MSSDNYTLLKQAFLEKRPALFEYHGHPRVVRVMELGWGAGEQERCLGWQYGGSSNSTALPAWRCFDVVEMGPVSLGEPDESNPDWNPMGEYRGGCLSRLDADYAV